MDSKELAIVCAQVADSKKAQDITIFDVDRLIGITDYFLLCNCESERQAQSISTEIEEVLRQKQCKCKAVEGYTEGKWILMDYGDVVVDIFLKEVREFYEIDELWADAPKIAWDVSPTAVYSEGQ